MAIGEMIDVVKGGNGNAQSAGGQPIVAAKPVEPAPVIENETAEGGNADGSATPVVGATVDANGQTTQATISLPKIAVDQIAALSTKTREQKAKIEELEGKLAPNPTLAADMAELALWREAKKTPHKLLELAETDMEKLAQSVYTEAEKYTADPRIETALGLIQAQKAEIEALKAETVADRNKVAETSNAKQIESAIGWATATIENGKLEDGSQRWENLVKDVNAGKAAFEATTKKVGEKFKDGKQPTLEEANAILAECLDEAEAVILAKQLLEARKTRGQGGTSAVQRKGIELVDGSEPGARVAPPPTIDGQRGPLRTGPTVQRGPTDVRTARARMLKIAGHE